MGAASALLRSTAGTSGSAAVPVRSDNASIVGGGSSMQGGRNGAPVSGPNTPLKMSTVTLVPSSSYATGGDSVDWSACGFDSVLAVIPLGHVSVLAANLSVMEYDHANGKLKVMKFGGAGAALAEAANASDNSTARFHALAIGT
jgi:hypothetical protein